MYAYFEGKLIEKTPTYAVIDCNGVGYMLNITLNTFTAIKDKLTCKLFSHLVVREDALTLYGFIHEQELELFKKLISVSGVGPSTARMVLSSLSAEEVMNAILSANVSVLESVKGIGAKTAQRIIVDLKDKLEKTPGIQQSAINIQHYNINRQEAFSALIMLGFNKNSVDKALDKILKNTENSLTVEEVIKHALQIL